MKIVEKDDPVFDSLKEPASVAKMRKWLKAYDDGILTQSELAMFPFWDHMAVAAKQLRKGEPMIWCMAGVASPEAPEPVTGTITIGTKFVEIVPNVEGENGG